VYVYIHEAVQYITISLPKRCKEQDIEICSVRVHLYVKKKEIGVFSVIIEESSSSLGATTLRGPWPPVLFTSTGLYPELNYRGIKVKLSRYRPGQALGVPGV
jgi:hypothetical protein